MIERSKMSRSEKKATSGSVYFAVFSEQVTETFVTPMVKIGFTEGDPRKRIQQLATASPFPLQIVGVIAGSKQMEKEIHERFEDLRVHREWFFRDQRIDDFIAGRSA